MVDGRKDDIHSIIIINQNMTLECVVGIVEASIWSMEKVSCH